MDIKELVENTAVNLWIITGHSGYLENEDDKVRDEYIKKAKQILSQDDKGDGVMKKKIYFRLNFITPPLDFVDGDELLTVRFYCISELNMPPSMIEAISVSKVEEVISHE